MKLGLLCVAYLLVCIHAQSLQDRRIANIKAIYDHLVYPNPLPLIRSNGTAATFFEPNVTGRITPVGVFFGRQETVEYFYALGNPVDGTIADGQTRVIQNDIRVLDIVGTRASIQVNIHLASWPSNMTVRNLTQTGWFGFNPNNDLVAWYDLTILRLGQASDQPAAYNGLIIKQLCAQQDTNCQASNQQYSSVPECIEFLSNNVTFGSWDNAFSDTVVCRVLHNLLTRVRPSFHCPHVGPTGGMKCIDHHYNEWYQEEYIVNLGNDTNPPSPPSSAPSASLSLSLASLVVASLLMMMMMV